MVANRICFHKSIPNNHVCNEIFFQTVKSNHMSLHFSQAARMGGHFTTTLQRANVLVWHPGRRSSSLKWLVQIDFPFWLFCLFWDVLGFFCFFSLHVELSAVLWNQRLLHVMSFGRQSDRWFLTWWCNAMTCILSMAHFAAPGKCASFCNGLMLFGRCWDCQ